MHNVKKDSEKLPYGICQQIAEILDTHPNYVSKVINNRKKLYKHSRGKAKKIIELVDELQDVQNGLIKKYSVA